MRKSTNPKFEDFYAILERLHLLEKQPFIVTYTDREGDLLPINNDDNYARALAVAKPVLRLCIQRKGNILVLTGIFCTNLLTNSVAISFLS